MTLRVAFQGAPGAFSEEAALRACGDAAEPVPMRENRDVTRAVAVGDVDLGVLPIENTLAGSVDVSYDAIVAEPAVHAIAEVVLPIHHCLLAVAGASVATLRVVESHPVALAQCAAFFQRHPELEARAVYDTAGAAQELARTGDVSRAAIAGAAAARRYGLVALETNIEDRLDNQTRFLVLSRTSAPVRPGQEARTLVVVTVDNRPGALLRVLTPLAERGLNMLKLESRPTGEPWTYRFLLEFEHRTGDSHAAEALSLIRAATSSFRVVGTYTPGA